MGYTSEALYENLVLMTSLVYDNWHRGLLCKTFQSFQLKDYRWILLSNALIFFSFITWPPNSFMTTLYLFTVQAVSNWITPRGKSISFKGTRGSKSWGYFFLTQLNPFQFGWSDSQVIFWLQVPSSAVPSAPLWPTARTGCDATWRIRTRKLSG